MEIVVCAFHGQLNLLVTLPAFHHRRTDGHGHRIAQELLFSSPFSHCFVSHSEVTAGGEGRGFRGVYIGSSKRLAWRKRPVAFHANVNFSLSSAYFEKKGDREKKKKRIDDWRSPKKGNVAGTLLTTGRQKLSEVPNGPCQKQKQFGIYQWGEQNLLVLISFFKLDLAPWIAQAVIVENLRAS